MNTELKNHLREYLQKLVDHPDDKYQLPVYVDGRPLTKLYVEPDILELENGHGKQGARSGQVFKGADRDRGRRVAWHSLVSQELRAGASEAEPWRSFVVAPPGFGKSLLLKMTARTLAQEALDLLQEQGAEPNEIPLPICVGLKSLVKSPPKSGEPPGTALSKSLAESLPWEPATASIKDNLASYLAEHAHERRVWLLLDDFDSLTDPICPDADWIFKGLQQWDCRVLITSRAYGHGAIRLTFPVSEYRLASLSPEQVGDFLARWFDKEDQRAIASAYLDQSASARNLSQIPLLLTWICRCLEHQSISQSVTRAELYDRLLRDLLGRRKNETQDEQRASEWLRALPEIALHCFEEVPGLTELPTDRLLEILSDQDIKDILPAVAELDPEEPPPRTDAEKVRNLLEELCRKGALFPLEARRSSYVMPHQSILEYLATRGLANRLERPGWHDPEATWAFIERKAWSPDWEQVILFLAGTLSDSRRRPFTSLVGLLSRLSEVKNDDYFRHRLALAGVCLGEISNEAREACAEPIKRITEDLFNYWWYHI